MDIDNIDLGIRFDCPGLDVLEIDPTTAEFEVFADSLKETDDATGLVRRLLTEHARSGPLDDAVAQRPPAATIRALSDQALDAAASAFVVASGLYFQPRWIREPGTAPLKLRPRWDEELDDLTARQGESGSQRLHRILTDWSRERRDRHAHFAEPTTSAVDAALEAATGPRARLGELAGHSRDQRAILGYRSEQTRLQDSLSAFGARMAGQQIAAQSALARAAAGIDTAPWMSATRELTRFVDDFDRKSRSIGDRIGQNWAHPASPSFASIFSDLGAFERLAADQHRNQQALAAVFGGPEISAFTRTWSDQHDFLKAVSRTLGLGLRAATIASLTTVSSPGLGRVPLGLDAASYLPAGYQLAGMLGALGEVPRGVAADVLKFYEPDEAVVIDTPFAVARDVTQANDDGRALDPVSAGDLVARIEVTLNERLTKERDPIRRAGLLEILAFVLAIYSAVLATATMALDLRADARDGAAASAPDPADQLGPVLEQLNTSLQEQKASELPEGRHLRYVHAPAPLRVEPDGKAIAIRTVYPDQPVRIEDERGGWVKVAVFDYHGDAEVIGWMARRHLRLSPLDH